MGAPIREELVLADSFSQTFRNFDAAANAAINVAESFQQTLNEFSEGFLDGLISSLNDSRAKLEDMAGSADEAARAQEEITRAASGTENEINNARKSEDEFRDSIERSERAAGSLMGTISKIAGAIGVVKLAENFIETSDEMSQISAKLNMINDGTRTTAQLQEEIYESAQRSRGAYLDTANLVARLGMNAGEAFGSNDEMIQFAENLNKSFKIAGASSQEQASVILQMSQALASGVLRGQEFNAVMSGAPNVMRIIAEYMGVSVGQLRDMAAEGQITAEIVKYAMLSATDSINEGFDQIPQTFSDIMTTAKNQITMSLSGAFEEWIATLNNGDLQATIDIFKGAFETLGKIGAKAFNEIAKAIGWVGENWETLEPIIEGAIAAILIYKSVNLLSAAAVGAAWVAAHAKIIATLGALYVGYEIAKDLAEAMFDDTPDIQKGGDTLSFSYKYKNGTFDPGEVKSAYEWDKDGGIAQAENNLAQAEKDLESTLNSISNGGISIKSYAELTGGGITTQGADWYAAVYGRDVGNHIPEELWSTRNAVEEINTTGVKVKGEVKLSDEDLKIFRDIAENRYIANVSLETLAPSVSVNVENNGQNMSEDDIASAVTKALETQISEHTAISHG